MHGNCLDVPVSGRAAVANVAWALRTCAGSEASCAHPCVLVRSVTSCSHGPSPYKPQDAAGVKCHLQARRLQLQAPSPEWVQAGPGSQGRGHGDGCYPAPPAQLSTDAEASRPAWLYFRSVMLSACNLPGPAPHTWRAGQPWATYGTLHPSPPNVPHKSLIDAD